MPFALYAASFFVMALVALFLPWPLTLFSIALAAIGCVMLVEVLVRWAQRRNDRAGFSSWVVPLLLVILLAPAVARAADDVVTAGDLFGAARPYLEWAIGGAVGAVLGWGGLLLKRHTGVAIDDRYRATLQEALERGVDAGLDVVQGLADKSGIEVRSRILAEAVRYVRVYSPAAAKHFRLSDNDLAELARPYLARLPAAVSFRLSDEHPFGRLTGV